MLDLVNAFVQRTPWRTLMLGLTLLQATVLRTRGYFMYRCIVSTLLITATVTYGFFATLTLNLVGKGHLGHRTTCAFLVFLVRTFLGINAEVEGKEHMNSNEPAIYLYNHQTLLDLHFISFEVPKNQTTIIAKEALKYYPFMGPFLMAIKTIFVKRDKKGNAVQQARYVAEKLNSQNTSIIVFPEGTRGGVDKVDLLPFKKGAFYMATQAKVPIVPVVVANYKSIYDPKKKHFGHGTIKIRVLPPIPTKDMAEDAETISKFAQDVQEQMLDTLKEISVLPQETH